MFKTLQAPVAVQIEVTEKCNNSCRHCYNFFRHQNYKHKTLTFEEIDTIFEQLLECQVAKVVITGGEPLMALEPSIYLAEKLKAARMGILFNSNLVIFNEKIGKRLQASGVTSIMTSLIADQPELHDYVTQREGSWERTTTGIRLASAMGFRVIVNMVLSKWNYHRLKQTGDLVGSWGVSKFGATRVCAPGPIAPQFSKNLISLEELRESLQVLLNLQERWGYQIDVLEHYPWCALGDVNKYRYLARRKCTAGVTSASIGADGQLRPCGHSSLKYGNVIEDGLRDAWAKMGDWREQIYTTTCSSCRHYHSCTGGCAADAMNSECGVDHHMANETAVISIPEETVLSLVAQSDPFMMPQDVILRAESFGGTVASGTGGTVYVDHEALAILEALRSRSYFTANDITNEFRVDLEDTRKVMARLESQRLIKKGGDLS